MLVRASLISAFLLSLLAEAGAAEATAKIGTETTGGPRPPEAGSPRPTSAEDLFGTPNVQNKLPIPALNPALTDGKAIPGAAQPAPLPPVIRSTKQKVDETGLRYFASQNQQKRVEKEIQRLKALYPDWSPPDDLFLGPPGGPDEQPFWDLFAADKLEDVRALIAERMKVEPKWKPSPALIFKIERKESRLKLVAAYEAKQWRKVIDVAVQDPKIMVCADIDVPWRVGEAFAQLGQKAQTFEVYRFILANCRDRDDRMTSMKKAATYFTPREMDVLIALGGRSEDGSLEFDEIRMDMLRVRIGAAAAALSAPKAETDPLDQPLPPRPDAAKAETAKPETAKQNSARSETARPAPAKTAEPARPLDARKPAAKAPAGKPADPKAADAKVQETKAPETKAPEAKTNDIALVDLRFFDSYTRKKKLSADAALLGWYLSARKDWGPAAEMFRNALDWPVQTRADGTAMEEPSKIAEGYILALKNLGQYEEAEKIAFEWGPKNEAIRGMFLDILGEALLKAPQEANFEPERLNRYQMQVATARSVFAAQALGWYYFNRQQWSDAIPWFQSSLSWTDHGSEDENTAAGLAVAYRGNNQFDDAEELAYGWRARSKALRDLYVDVFAESLVRQSAPLTFPPERITRYASEIEADKSAVGAQGLAWYHYDRKLWGDAARWFRTAMEWSKNGRGDDKLAEGLAQSLRQDKQYIKAEDVAYDWHEKSTALRTLFLEITAENLVTMPVGETYPIHRLNRFASHVNQIKSLTGTEAVAWYFYNRRNFVEAVRWFKSALDLKPEESRYLKLVEGHILSLRYLGSVNEAENLAYDWREKTESLRKVYIEIAAEVISTLKPPAAHPANRMDRFVELTRATRSSFGAQAVGWYHHQRQDFKIAAEWFNTSLEWGGEITDAKTAQGYLLALISLGRMDEADKLAFEWHEKSEEFRTLYIDTFGGAILRATPPQTFPEAMLRRFEYIAAFARSVFGSQAVGWYFYDRQDWSNAARWFQASLDWAGTAHHDQKTVEGFAQSIRYMARREEAEDILFQWRDKNPLLRKLYIELFAEGLVNTSAPVLFSDERLDRFADVVLTDRDFFGAQGLAWYRHDRRQWADAVRWFKYAREWSKDASGDAKMAEGLAFSLRNLDLYDESEFVSVEWKDKHPGLRKLYSETVGEYLVRMKPEFTYPNERMERYLATVTEDRNNVGAQSAGWYFYARNLFDPAAQWLLQSLAWGPDAVRDPKTAEGYITALRLGGKLAEAELAAFEWFDKSPALRALYFDIAGQVLSALKPPATMADERLARFVTLTEEEKSVTGAIALAWYYHARDTHTAAAAWFERAIGWGGETPDIKAVEGYVAALIGLDRFDEAEKLVFAWRERSDRIAGLYLDLFGARLISYPKTKQIDAARLERYMLVAGAEKSAFGAQALAWYHYDRQIWAESARWFEANLNWAGEAHHDEKSIEGFAQSLRYIGRREEAEDILYAWRDRTPALRKLYVEIMAEGLVSSTNPVIFSDARLDRFAELILKDRDFFGAQGLAWYRHDRRQWPDAVRWFKYAREWSEEGKGDAKMAEGLAFSLRNLELYDESEFVSVEWKDRSPAMRKLYSETVGEYLVRMKPDFSYPDERMARFLAVTTEDHNNIGAQSAGWYYYAREMYDPAAQWFLASLNWGPDVVRDPKTAEGYVTSLRLGGRLIEAEAAAFDLRDRSPALQALYFDIAGQVIAAMKPPSAMPVERLARFAALTAESNSVPGAQALAWYHQAREEWSDSAYWFQQSIDWAGNANDPKANEGMLVALVGLGRYEEAENLVHAWRQSNPAMAAMYMDVFGGALLRFPKTETIDQDRLDRFGVIVGLEKNTFGSKALAWYHYERQNWAEAVRWFQASLGWTAAGKHEPKSVEGFVQALRHVGRRDEAEELLFQWRDTGTDMRKLYIETVGEALINQDAPIVLPDHRIDRFAHVVLADRSSFGAQALAWYRYNRRAWADAARWFKSARVWSADGKGDAKMAEGLAFSLRNMELYDESEAVSWEWRDRSPAVRKLYTETVAEFLVRLKERETYPLDRLSRFQSIVSADKSSIGAQAAGWYYHARDRFGEAVPWFRNALAWGPDPVRDPKTAEGLAIALYNSGAIEEAEAFAYLWRDRSESLRGMYFDYAGIAMGRVQPPASYAVERMARYVTMTNSARSAAGAQAIGWYRAARKEWPEALQWFKQALDWQGELKDPKTIEGYVLALRNSGRLDEAETLALAWRDRNGALGQSYMEMLAEAMVKLDPNEAMPTDRMERFTAAVMERQWIPGAQSIGWYMLNRKMNAEGETWFKNALAWSPDGKDPALLEGYAVSMKRQFKYAEADAVAYDLLDRSESVRELYRLNWIEWLVKTKAPAAIPPDRLKKFVDYANRFKVASAARALGWYYFDRKDWPQAHQWFNTSIGWEADKENTKGAEGVALVLKNMGKEEEAENFAYEWRDRSDAMRSLFIDSVPQMLAKLGETGTFPTERLKRFATQVTAAKSAYGAQALGWYAFQRKDYAPALGWFKNALDWAGDAKDPKIAEGYALSLRASGRLDEAETLAYEWRERADGLRTIYIDVFAEALTKSNPPPAFAPERLTRYAALVSADKSATGAQALGWYSFNIKQFRPARAWFEKAMQWAPSEGSALGLALSARSMNDKIGFANIIATYRNTYPKLAEMVDPKAVAAAATPATETLAVAQQPQPQVRVIETVRTVKGRPQRVTRTVTEPAPAASSGGGSTSGCVARIEARERSGAATSADYVQKGWCLLNQDRPQEASIAFERGRGRGGEAAYGQALSRLRSGETDDAARSADMSSLTPKQRSDIGQQVLGQRIIASYRAGRYYDTLRYLDERGAYAAETRDLASMRGWALFKIGRKDAARRIFTELDGQLSTNETQNALSVMSEVRP